MELDIGGDLLSKKTPLRKLFDLMTDGRVDYHPLDDNYDVAVFGDEEIGWCGSTYFFVPFPSLVVSVRTFCSLHFIVSRRRCLFLQLFLAI